MVLQNRTQCCIGHAARPLFLADQSNTVKHYQPAQNMRIVAKGGFCLFDRVGAIVGGFEQTMMGGDSVCC